MRRSLIIGIGGQDGSYLREFLRSKGHEVFGVRRPVANRNRDNTPSIFDTGVIDREAVLQLVGDLQPHEIYYLAAYHQSSEALTGSAENILTQSFDVNTIGLSNVLDAALRTRVGTRVFYAASSRVFGNPATSIQDERTPFNPVCPYGISKAAGIYICRYYRQHFKAHCSAGILYNHESPRRPASFVSRKIVKAAVEIRKGMRRKLSVGNLDALVDWGYAPDYTEAMWAIMQLDRPDDFVIASGTLHSVRDFVQTAFEAVELNWERYVSEDRQMLSTDRPLVPLCGDSRKLQALTGWRPQVSFSEMVRYMVEAELSNS